MSLAQNVQSEDNKLSHKQRRAQAKKLKRKNQRQESAKQRDELQQQEKAALESSARYLREQLLQQKQEKQQRKQDERIRLEMHAQWLLREKEGQQRFLIAKAKTEKEKWMREEEERRIREEWEVQQKKEEEEEKKRKEEEEEKKVKQAELLKEATANEKKGDGPWHNPIAPSRTGGVKEQDICPFFHKVGACRFAERCSRAHPEPEVCNTLLLPGMYNNFKLEQSHRDEYDTDLGLEYDDSDVYQDFLEFYQDVLPEFKAIGKVVQFKVCCNYEPHLRGNVYIQYSKEEDANSAMAKFNSRWYGGRQLSCYFVQIDKWCNAICGQFFNRKCPKGKSCNFLHVFRNPRREFREADFDKERSYYNSRREDRSHHSVRSSVRRHHRSRSRSPRTSKSHRKRSYSRSKSRSPKRRCRSPDYSRRSSRSLRKRSYSRSRSKSPNYSRSKQKQYRSGSRKRSYSKSPDGKKSHKHRSRSDSWSPEWKRSHRSRSRSRSDFKHKNHRARSQSKSPDKESSTKLLTSTDSRPEVSESALPGQEYDQQRLLSNVNEVNNKLNLSIASTAERSHIRSPSNTIQNSDIETITSRESVTSPVFQPVAINQVTIEVVNGEEQICVTKSQGKKKKKHKKEGSRSRSSSSQSRSRSRSPSIKHKSKKHKKHKHKNKSKQSEKKSPSMDTVFEENKDTVRAMGSSEPKDSPVALTRLHDHDDHTSADLFVVDAQNIPLPEDLPVVKLNACS